MVIGLDKFREHFAGEEDKYIIIGGTACDVNLRESCEDKDFLKSMDKTLGIGRDAILEYMEQLKEMFE